MTSHYRTNSLNEIVNRKLMINDFDYPSKKGKQEKDDVSMDEKLL
jgi:hypothetical protein